MKISIVTATYNSEALITHNLKSVQSQVGDYELEHVVQDGGSTDNTIEIVEGFQALSYELRTASQRADEGSDYRLKIADSGEYKSDQSAICYPPYPISLGSQSDSGFYDAINKGIGRSSGDVIGLLNSDDFYASHDVLATVENMFKEKPEIDLVYGNLDYVKDLRGSSSEVRDEDGGEILKPLSQSSDFRVTRRWRSGTSSFAKWKNGWMPAHPTVYVRREVYEKFGGYRLDMGTAADYEWMLRVFAKHADEITTFHIPKVFVNMRVGGISNANSKARLNANANDRKAWEVNGLVPNPWFRFTKPLRKVPQWIHFADKR